jgi:tetratricopeptide (TPR) repeat protein
LQQKITGGYEGKCTTRHKMNILKLKRLIGKDLPADAVEQARASIVQAAGNIYEKQEYVRLYEAELGELLIHVGRVSEGEALLDQLAAAGSREARIARLIHWIKTGRTRGVEAELQKLLKESRSTGRKMDELVFYQLYADFLEQQGRLNEALRVRRELVQLCKAFDIFTHLPVEMAKLAALLNRLGIWDESLLIANQARELLGKGQIPDHLVRKAQDILDKIIRGKPIADEKDPAILVDFQPFQSVVMPLKGASWVSHLMLSNPSGTDQSGMLRSIGLPVRFQEVDGQFDGEVAILATLGGKAGDQELKVEIEPAGYKIIALNASKDFTGHGKLALAWTPNKGAGRAESKILLEEALGGATKAIIQAGAYKLNPFYGIPVYHHYLDTEPAKHSQPMRFACSEKARIEIYDMDGIPIAIDGQGNGSLRDAGDELFGAGDGHGNLHLPLTKGSASFRIMIYPQQEIPDDGLSLRIECLDEGKWELYAEDRLMPATAKD